MAAAGTAHVAPSATTPLGQNENEPVLALLADIGASLKDLQNHSARLMSLVDPPQRARSVDKRRAARRNGSRHSRYNTRTRNSRRRRRSTESSSEYSTAYTDSNRGIMEGDEEVIVIKRERRLEENINDGEGSTAPDIRPVVMEGENSRRGFSTTSQNPLKSRYSDDSIVEVVEERVENKDSQDSLRSSASSISTELFRSKEYHYMEVKYGDFPEIDLCQQLFGDLPGRDSDEYSSWLKEKGLVFARDDQCGFAFDNVSLANEQSLAGVQNQVGKVEDFTRDLRRKGGFLFFRESYTGSRSDDNKIYNGTHVFRCADRAEEALPMLSGNGKNFSEEIPEVRPLGEMGDDASLRVIWNTRNDMTRLSELTNSVAYGENYVDPALTYYYKGEPVRVLIETGSGWVTEHQDGTQSPERTVCLKYEDAHIAAPWRRLCVLTGLSRISTLTRDNVWQKVPLFSGDRHTRSLNVKGGSSTNDVADNDFFEECILEHLDCKQLFVQHDLSMSTLKFQFSWYEIIHHRMSEKRQSSGTLYRDNSKRSLQLQSFMVIGLSQFLDKSSFGDNKYWTLIVMAPAFFYHQEGDTKVTADLHDLMAPLHSLESTICKILSMIMSRVLSHWREVGDYVEQFIAAQNTFLHEDQHDWLLFDDDNFTRSRQYFWVITSTGEFIPIVDETIHHFNEVTEWIYKHSDVADTYDGIRADLIAIRERFEKQRNRATTLRDGLFNASAVVESRLSTRLAQNVKLLTYVSIFYLPLAFCAALWAIPNITDPSTRTPFIVAAILVGLATYLTVFNLDALVSVGSTTYSGFREKRIHQMAKDLAHDTWQERARGFKRFEPDRGKTKPSEWYIMWYWLMHPFGGPRKAEGDVDGEEEYASTRSELSSYEVSSISVSERSRGIDWKLWLRKLFKNSESSREKNGPSTV